MTCDVGAMTLESATRLLVIAVCAVNVLTLMYRGARYGKTWNMKTHDAVWVLGLWSGVALLAQVDQLTGNTYSEVRAGLVLVASGVTCLMIFRRYDDHTTMYNRGLGKHR